MNSIRVITIEREFGSGRSAVAKKLAQRLGWKLWDKMLVSKREERTDPLYYRLLKSFMQGSFEGSASAPPRGQ
jgi:deoxyadenosine/deoxycytidine kinase